MATQHNSLLFLRLPKITLTAAGVWMLPHRNTLYKMHTSCVLLMFYSFLIFNFIHILVVWGDVDLMSEGSYLLFTHISTCWKARNFVLRKGTLGRLLDAMDSKMFAPKTDEHDAILRRYSKTVRIINLFMVVSCFAVCALWGVTPQMDKTKRLLPFTVWMPGDTQKSPNYEIIYVYQMLMILGAGQIFLAIDVLFVGLILFTCAQLEMIMVNTQKMQKIPSSGLNQNDRKKLMDRNNQLLSECIMHHQATNRFLKLAENMFHVPIFVQMSGSILIVCVVGFRITIEQPNTLHFYSTLNYLLLMLTQLFLYCWCGNELTDKSEKLRDCLYGCPWYDNSKKFKKTLSIALECQRHPVVFRAGYYIPLSRPTFISILRCSYSYFAVLNHAQRTAE